MAGRAEEAHLREVEPLTAAFPPADCRDCSRCCFSTRADYIAIFAFDWDRMTAPARALTTNGPRGRRHMRFSNGHCEALVPDASGRRLHCSIYEERPDVCRALVRGTGDCREHYVEKAGRPDVALLSLLRVGRSPL